VRMSTQWLTTRLAEVCHFQNGYAFKNSDYVEEGEGAFEIFRMGHILKGGGFNPDGKKALVSAELAARLQRFLLSEGDILMCMTDMKANVALLGHTARMPVSGQYLVNQRVGRITVRNPEVLDQRFLYYYSNTPDYIHWLRSHANSGVQVNLSTEAILNSPITCPPLSTQRRIAGILSAYDELIENSQRRIKILEAMARALYREWFVHFRFPGHESVPRVPSPVGEIPKGWEVKKLGDLINIDKGVSYNGAGLTEDGNPMVNLKNILAGGGFRRDATKPYSGDFKPRHTVRPGDIILANTDLTQAGNVVASAAMVPRSADERPILISHHLFAVRLPDLLPAAFMYHLLLEDAFRGFAKGYAIGTTVLGLPKEGVLNFAFALPPQNLIAEFKSQVEPLHQLVETTLERIDNLRRTRDLLLPRLFSGQIDVEAMPS
jgi:type I restriction enzyme S subunit